MIYFKAIMPNGAEIEHLSKIIANLHKMNKILPNAGEVIKIYNGYFLITEKTYSEISMGNVTIIYSLERVK